MPPQSVSALLSEASLGGGGQPVKVPTTAAEAHGAEEDEAEEKPAAGAALSKAASVRSQASIRPANDQEEVLERAL